MPLRKTRYLLHPSQLTFGAAGFEQAAFAVAVAASESTIVAANMLVRLMPAVKVMAAVSFVG